VDARIDPKEEQLVYRPALLGMATVQFVNAKHRVDERKEVTYLLQPPESRSLIRWEDADALDIGYRDLETKPAEDALFGDVPSIMSTARKLTGLAKDLSDYLYHDEAIVLPHNVAVGLVARPDESEREFTVRCREAAREARDEEVDKLSEKFEKKIDTLQARLGREERELAEDEADYTARKREELISAGESVLGLFLGRRSSRGLSTAARKRRYTTSAQSDIAESKATIADLMEDIAALEAELAEEAEDITGRWADSLDQMEEIRITPRRADVRVQLFALAWAPYWAITYEDARGRERSDGVAAFAAD